MLVDLISCNKCGKDLNPQINDVQFIDGDEGITCIPCVFNPDNIEDILVTNQIKLSDKPTNWLIKEKA